MKLEELEQGHNRLSLYLKEMTKNNQKEDQENESIKEQIRTENIIIYNSEKKSLEDSLSLWKIIFPIFLVNSFIAIEVKDLAPLFYIFNSMIAIYGAMSAYFMISLSKMKKVLNETGKLPRIFGFEYTFEKSEKAIAKVKRRFERNRKKTNDFSFKNDFVLNKEELEYHYKIIGECLTENEIAKTMNELNFSIIGKYETIDHLYLKAKEKMKNKSGNILDNETKIKQQLKLLHKNKTIENSVNVLK